MAPAGDVRCDMVQEALVGMERSGRLPHVTDRRWRKHLPVGVDECILAILVYADGGREERREER